MSDDQILLQTWNGYGIYHMGDRFDFEAEIRRNKWWKRFVNTCEYLEAHERPTFFYDCHCPIRVLRDEFIRIAEEADYKSPPGMCINTLYCNSVDMLRQHMNGQKLAVHRRMGPKKLRRLSKDKLFLGYNEIGTNKWMKRFLEERFPEKSRFEK
jgi:hypothetical protein